MTTDAHGRSRSFARVSRVVDDDDRVRERK
jgi:hypothetical protein